MSLDSVVVQPHAQDAMARRVKTWAQLEAMKQKAVRFVRDVLGDAERAEEIQVESPEEYAERKGVRIVENPVVLSVERRLIMADSSMSKSELEAVLDRIEDLCADALDPSLSREQVIDIVKQIAEEAESEEGPEDQEEEEVVELEPGEED